MRRAALALVLAALVAPAGASTAQGPVAHAIPFQFVMQRQIVFPMRVNGKPAEAWLDSGASATVLDAAFAKRLGIELGPAIPARGVAGQVSDVHLARADLAAGDLAMSGRRVVVMDLSNIARIVHRPVEVLLGRDVFDEAVVDIDFEGRTVGLIPRDAFTPPAGAPVPLKPSADLRSLPIEVAGTPMQAILDLGNSGGLLIDRDFADHSRLLDGHRRSNDLGVGAEGAREQALAALDKVSVGGIRFDRVPTVATAGLSSRAPANVGIEILSRFHLTIDYAGDRIWMAPYADAADRPFRKNRAGLALVPEDAGLAVEFVAAGSPAERAGWRKGDRITALDGRPIPPDYAVSDASLWIYGPAGRSIVLTDGAGRKKKLTLADYY
jgi:hypothetical protein